MRINGTYSTTVKNVRLFLIVVRILCLRMEGQGNNMFAFKYFVEQYIAFQINAECNQFQSREIHIIMINNPSWPKRIQ
jgi:hypothetical protein